MSSSSSCSSPPPTRSSHPPRGRVLPARPSASNNETLITPSVVPDIIVTKKKQKKRSVVVVEDEGAEDEAEEEMREKLKSPKKQQKTNNKKKKEEKKEEEEEEGDEVEAAVVLEESDDVIDTADANEWPVNIMHWLTDGKKYNKKNGEIFLFDPPATSKVKNLLAFESEHARYQSAYAENFIPVNHGFNLDSPGPFNLMVISCPLDEYTVAQQHLPHRHWMTQPASRNFTLDVERFVRIKSGAEGEGKLIDQLRRKTHPVYVSHPSHPYVMVTADIPTDFRYVAAFGFSIAQAAINEQKNDFKPPAHIYTWVMDSSNMANTALAIYCCNFYMMYHGVCQLEPHNNNIKAQIKRMTRDLKDRSFTAAFNERLYYAQILSATSGYTHRRLCSHGIFTKKTVAAMREAVCDVIEVGSFVPKDFVHLFVLRSEGEHRSYCPFDEPSCICQMDEDDAGIVNKDFHDYTRKWLRTPAQLDRMDPRVPTKPKPSASDPRTSTAFRIALTNAGTDEKSKYGTPGHDTFMLYQVVPVVWPHLIPTLHKGATKDLWLTVFKPTELAGELEWDEGEGEWDSFDYIKCALLMESLETKKKEKEKSKEGEEVAISALMQFITPNAQDGEKMETEDEDEEEEEEDEEEVEMVTLQPTNAQPVTPGHPEAEEENKQQQHDPYTVKIQSTLPYVPTYHSVFWECSGKTCHENRLKNGCTTHHPFLYGVIYSNLMVDSIEWESQTDGIPAIQLLLEMFGSLILSVNYNCIELPVRHPDGSIGGMKFPLPRLINKKPVEGSLLFPGSLSGVHKDGALAKIRFHNYVGPILVNESVSLFPTYDATSPSRYGVACKHKGLNGCEVEFREVKPEVYIGAGMKIRVNGKHELVTQVSIRNLPSDYIVLRDSGPMLCQDVTSVYVGTSGPYSEICWFPGNCLSDTVVGENQIYIEPRLVPRYGISICRIEAHGVIYNFAPNSSQSLAANLAKDTATRKELRTINRSKEDQSEQEREKEEEEKKQETKKRGEEEEKERKVMIEQANEAQRRVIEAEQIRIEEHTRVLQATLRAQEALQQQIETELRAQEADRKKREEEEEERGQEISPIPPLPVSHDHAMNPPHTILPHTGTQFSQLRQESQQQPPTPRSPASSVSSEPSSAPSHHRRLSSSPSVGSFNPCIRENHEDMSEYSEPRTGDEVVAACSIRIRSHMTMERFIGEVQNWCTHMDSGMITNLISRLRIALQIELDSSRFRETIIRSELSLLDSKIELKKDEPDTVTSLLLAQDDACRSLRVVKQLGYRLTVSSQSFLQRLASLRDTKYHAEEAEKTAQRHVLSST